jgi:hypothetical membrane protein
MNERLKYLGVGSGVIGWLVILAAISLNPWFVFTEHAFSDLRGKLSQVAWVFNNGMMFNGLLIAGYGFYLVSESSNKITTVGSAFTIISGAFLMLIGAYPTGTYPHYFVSVYFFAQTDIAIWTWGLGLIRTGKKDLGWTFLALSIVGPIIAGFVDWPSTAVVEAYGILIMTIWVALMLRLK